MQFNSAFAVSFHSTRSDARVRFDRGAIFLDQSRFFATHSNQWNCFILNRSDHIEWLFFMERLGKGRAKGRLSRYVEIFWDKIGFSLLYNISDTLGYASCATFLFLPHFDVIRLSVTATWNLFVKYKCGWKFGRTRNAVSTAFSSSPKLSWVFA